MFNVWLSSRIDDRCWFTDSRIIVGVTLANYKRNFDDWRIGIFYWYLDAMY
jgi:hypothetical protein